LHELNQGAGVQAIQAFRASVADLVGELERFGDNSGGYLAQCHTGLQADLKQLQLGVAHEARERLQATVQQLIEKGVEALADAIAAAITEAQIGEAVTAGISEVLPELIVIRKCLDLLREAIQSYKWLRNVTGGWL